MQEQDDQAMVRISQPINLEDIGKLLPTQFSDLSEGNQEYHIRDILRYYEDEEIKVQQEPNVPISEYSYYSDDVNLDTQRNQESVGYLSDYKQNPQKQTDAMIKDIFNDL